MQNLAICLLALETNVAVVLCLQLLYAYEFSLLVLEIIVESTL